jgi:hypothetical protein
MTDEIKTRFNKNNLYTSLSLAKKALKSYLAFVNKKILDKNLQVKYDHCKIVEYELVEKEEH